MTDYNRPSGDEGSGQHQHSGWSTGPAYPPPPAYGPILPPAHHGHGGAAPARRAKGPLALLAAVAIAAAVVGGGTATLVGQYTDSATGGSSTTISGTTVSQSSSGTVAGVAQAVSPSIVEINAASSGGQSTGSGVIITSDGQIITNNHVIAGASSIKVQLSSGKTYDAQVLGTDADKDLALVKLDGASGLKTATLGDSDQVRVGDQAVAIGSPEGLTGTVTSGIISALDRDVTVAKEQDQGQQQQQQGDGGWPFEFGGRQFNGDTGSSKTTYKALQTDASLNPGNSGGALINMNGQIIGINSAMYAPSSATSGGDSGAGSVGSVGLGFAIPVNTVKADLSALRSGGTNSAV
ncbi:S1C family serine protease [Streptomyces sp. AK02-01A]|uniref:S1C family serine protease n=1 Tax=Streptomyces sp. AK02-01A TaxID=3028648 RepID=UPI0029A1B59F|nr:trypsin-like peptidase domain-containing protein [Streptomyces sp. AK02-01A]MDX3853255.1 trypsin-like peptidase domain-containing protein [Streptomyces sp. AK02-01A]